jgi:2-polyprenyl-3-methyl-5-hydroxy-6-metoxy-1,4-benzoquinol methylase
MAKIKAPAKGLDFGCGPGPALAAMLSEQGYQMACYDPAYFPDQSLLAQHYDFITSTEVIEHIHQPRPALMLLAQLLRPGGLLVIMTKRVRDAEAFKTWHYKNDPTHVRFYSQATFEYIAHWLEMSLEVVDNDVVILQRNTES